MYKMRKTCMYVSQPYTHASEGKFEKDTIFLNTAFFKDLNWFYTFPRQFNGVVYYDYFLEYLVDNLLSVANICNYLAALRTVFIIHNLPTQPFRDEKIQMFVKSVRINGPLVVKTNSIFTEKILLDIIAATKTLEFSESFLSIYLLAFFSFLRLSNVVPHAKNGFDPSRHLARGDIIFF